MTAGCLGGTLGSPVVSVDVSPENVEPSTSTPLVETDASPTVRIVVGDDRSGDPRPHWLWLWNDGERRDLELTLTRTANTPFGESTARVVQRTETLAADAVLAVELWTPGEYDLALAGDGVAETISVPRSRFDCNDATTSVAIRADGVETQTVSTSMGCGGQLFRRGPRNRYPSR